MTTTSSAGVTISHLQRCPEDGWWELAWRCADRDHFQAIVQAVKDLPLERRRYVPYRHLWRIASASLLMGLGVYLPGLKERVEELLAESEPRPAVSAPPPAVERAYVTLFLLPTAPRCVIRAAYRALAGELHPDVGGTTSEMQRLNAARDTLTSWLDADAHRSRDRRGGGRAA